MAYNKTILILSRRDDRPDYDTAASMVAKMQPGSQNVAYDPCFLEEVGFVFDGQNLKVINTRNGKDVSQYDGIFLLGWFKLRKHEEVALAVSLYAKYHGVPSLNSEALHNRSRSKISQYVMSALNGVATTPYVMITDSSKIAGLLKASELEYPLIAKSVTGSRGRDNFLVNNDDELEAALAAAPTKGFVVQTFVPNDGDYRILVMGGRVRLVIHRRAVSDGHLNNTSKGGQATVVDPQTLAPSLLEDAVRMSELLRREVTGVDMIVHRDTGRAYFLEANNMPQLSTGSFVDEKAAVLNEFFAEWTEAGKG